MGLPVWLTVVIGLVMTGLLPALSGCRVSVGTAILASFAGQMVRSSAVRCPHTRCCPRGRARPLRLMTTGTPLVALGMSVLGIVVPAWMGQSSAGGRDSGRGPRYDLYSRARQTSLDEPPQL